MVYMDPHDVSEADEQMIRTLYRLIKTDAIDRLSDGELSGLCVELCEGPRPPLGPLMRELARRRRVFESSPVRFEQTEPGVYELEIDEKTYTLVDLDVAPPGWRGSHYEDGCMRIPFDLRADNVRRILADPEGCDRPYCELCSRTALCALIGIDRDPKDDVEDGGPIGPREVINDLDLYLRIPGHQEDSVEDVIRAYAASG